MNKCERCKNKLSRDITSTRRPVPVTYGETDMTICYSCAVELTYIIGAWLNSDPLDDPHQEDTMTWLPGVGLAYDAGEHDPIRLFDMK